MRGNTGTGVGSGRSFGDDDSDLEDLSGMFADPNRARAHARARARGRASELKGGRGDAAYANLPRSNGQGRGFVPAQREVTPPPAIVNAPTTVNSPSTTNVSQNATSLAPTDRVLDQLSVAI